MRHADGVDDPHCLRCPKRLHVAWEKVIYEGRLQRHEEIHRVAVPLATNGVDGSNAAITFVSSEIRNKMVQVRRLNCLRQYKYAAGILDEVNDCDCREKSATLENKGHDT